MKVILDTIVGNMLLFAGVLLFLLAIFFVLIKEIIKNINNHRIPVSVSEGEKATKKEKTKEEVVVVKENKKEEKDTVAEEQPKPEEIKEMPKQETTKEKQKKNQNILEMVYGEEEANDILLDTKAAKKPVDPLSEEIEIKGKSKKEKAPLEDMDLEELESLAQKESEAKLEELEKVDDREIEERIDSEHKEDIEQEIIVSENEEIKELLVELKENIDPEEVVRNFEEEQEAQSIISYQELVDVVKNRDNEFIDELEAKPLSTVSDFVPEANKKPESEVEVLELIEELEATDEEDSDDEDSAIEELVVSQDEEREDSLKEIPEEGKFKKTEVISPVYGRINVEKEIEYPKVEKFDRTPKSPKEDFDGEEEIEVLELPKEKSETIIAEIDNTDLFEDLSSVKAEDEIEEFVPEAEYVEEIEKFTPEETKSFEEVESLIPKKAPFEEIVDNVEIDKDILESVMPSMSLPKSDYNANIEGIDEAGALEALGSFNSMLSDVSKELAKKDKKKPEEVIEEISTDTEEIAALTSTHNFSQDEEFLNALKDFRDNL